MLLNATHHWPEMVLLELWILDLLEAARIANLTRFDKDGRSPHNYFSYSDALFNIKNEYAFGCPAFVLDESLQSGKKIPK